MKMMTNKPARKVMAATFGGPLAAAIVAFLVWVLGEYGIKIPDDLVPHLIIIVGAIGSFLAGYFTPPAGYDQIVETQ